MHFRFPTHIPVAKALLFTCGLVLVELLEGTQPLYSLLIFTFFMLSVFAFNVAGGFSRPSGAYIAFYAFLACELGTIYKAILGQAADTHLSRPLLLMAVYNASILVMLVAAFFSRKIATTRDGVAGLLQVPQIDFGTSALGCIVIVFLINNAFQLFPGGAGSILHAIALINNFLPLGILLGTIAAVRNSGGRHSTTPLVLCTLIYFTYAGLLTFSKQGMFTGFVCWVLGLAWSGFRLRPKHILTIAVFVVVAQGFMVPLSNVGRNESVTGSSEERVAIVTKYLLHPFQLREINRIHLEEYATIGVWYFGTPQGIFDRFTMLPNDSQLIAYTVDQREFGMLPLLEYYQNWVPHFLAPHKLEGVVLGGNVYAHELGWVADEDWSTGISFSPSAEAFHLGGWFCVLLIQPFIYITSFIFFDAVSGDIRRQPWGLLPVLLFGHIAPEGLLGGLIVSTWLGNVGTIFAVFICGFVTPVFGRLLKGRERAPIWAGAQPQLTQSVAAGT